MSRPLNAHRTRSQNPSVISQALSCALRAIGAGTRTLWSGTAAGRIAVVAFLVVLATWAGGTGAVAVEQLLTLALVLGAFVFIYGLIFHR